MSVDRRRDAENENVTVTLEIKATFTAQENTGVSDLSCAEPLLFLVQVKLSTLVDWHYASNF